MGFLSAARGGELGFDRARVLREAQDDELGRLGGRQPDAPDDLAGRDHRGRVHPVTEVDEAKSQSYPPPRSARPYSIY